MKKILIFEDGPNRIISSIKDESEEVKILFESSSDKMKEIVIEVLQRMSGSVPEINKIERVAQPIPEEKPVFNNPQIIIPEEKPESVPEAVPGPVVQQEVVQQEPIAQQSQIAPSEISKYGLSGLAFGYQVYSTLSNEEKIIAKEEMGKILDQYRGIDLMKTPANEAKEALLIGWNTFFWSEICNYFNFCGIAMEGLDIPAFITGLDDFNTVAIFTNAMTTLLAKS